MSQRSFHALLCNPLCAFVKHGAGFCFARIHLRGPHITRAGEAPPCPHSSAPRVAGRFAVYNLPPRAPPFALRLCSASYAVLAIVETGRATPPHIR